MTKEELLNKLDELKEVINSSESNGEMTRGQVEEALRDMNCEDFSHAIFASILYNSNPKYATQCLINKLWAFSEVDEDGILDTQTGTCLAEAILGNEALSNYLRAKLGGVTVTSTSKEVKALYENDKEGFMNAIFEDQDIGEAIECQFREDRLVFGDDDELIEYVNENLAIDSVFDNSNIRDYASENYTIEEIFGDDEIDEYVNNNYYIARN